MRVQRCGFAIGLAAVLSSLTAFLFVGCVGRVNSPAPTPTAALPPAISVSVSPTSATVQLAKGTNFTATVTNDSQSKGVTWALSGAGCSGASCGALSAKSSASGAAINYTASAGLPAPATVTLTATSAADTTKSAAAAITLAAPPISVSVSPPSATVLANATQSFTATLQNDLQSKDVAWTLSGTSCAGNTCGVVSPASSLSGASVIYTAPASVPAGTVSLTATSIADSTKSASAAITVTAPPIVVTVSPATTSVASGGATQMFTATLQNDSQNQGVTWALLGAGCTGAACGTVSPASSASGVTVTYTSPARVPSPATVSLTATSVATTSVYATATITVAPPPVPTPSAPIVLGQPLIDQGYGDPAVATDLAGNVDVAWVDINGAAFVRSTDGGTTFSTPLRIPSDLSNTTGPENDIQIDLDASGNINLLWRLDPTGADTSLENIFSRSTDGGLTFSTPVNISTTPTSAQLAVQPNGAIVVTWFDQATSNLMAASSADGVAFSSPVTVWTAVGNPMDLASVVGPQGQIYLFWTQLITTTNCSILFSKSTDALTFSTAASISANSDACNQTPAAFADSRGNIDVAWDADGASIFFSRSTDSGATFSPPASVPTGASPNSQEIAVGPDGEIYIVWESQSGMLFSQSTDNGATFASSPTTLSLATGGSSPVLGVDSCSNISVVGQDSSTNMVLQRSLDGVTFGDPITLSTLPNDFYPGLSVDQNGNVNVTWEIDGPHDVVYVRIPTTCSLH